MLNPGKAVRGRFKAATTPLRFALAFSPASRRVETEHSQDVKGHIRDKHCLTFFHCPRCLRSDFSSERMMRKHSDSCKKPQVGVCGTCRLPWWGWATWVEHARAHETGEMRLEVPTFAPVMPSTSTVSAVGQPPSEDAGDIQTQTGVYTEWMSVHDHFSGCDEITDAILQLH
jgi:hypothetical protein